MLRFLGFSFNDKKTKKQEEIIEELDRIAKGLVRRDLELSSMREKREKEFKEVKRKTKELERTRKGLLNILEDVAWSRREAEEERNKTLAIITNFTDGLLVFDEQKRLSLMNPQAESFLSIKSGKVLGKTLDSISRISSLKPLMNFLKKDINSVFRKELKMHGDLILEVSVISMPRKNQTESLVILHDITREKRIERMKSEFVSITAHQLRTPLSAIKWTLKMFLEGDLGKVSKEQEEFLEKTYGSNERMINLINDLLNVTRIEEGRYLHDLVLIDIDKTIQYLIDMQEVGAKEKGVKLEYKKPKKKLPNIKADEEKISLAIQNLIDNAIKYTPKGGEVIVSLKDKKEGLEISVKDNGIGIPKNQQKRVFTKFFRAGNALKVDTDGSGLGLFIVKNIVRAHNGKVSFKSRKDKGTTFSILLPKQN